MPTDFLALGIRREVNDTLRENGLTEPTPIQEQAIPLLISGKDVIAQAQTGTGKTLAFVLPILETIDPEKPYVQALIITPTRELALQITTEVKKLAGKVGAKVLAAYGGQDVDRQIKKLEGNTHIVIGTPGRLLDHLRRETIQLSGVSLLVLDEADQMLHMGFLAEVEEIILQTSPKRQTMLFSATIPQQIRALAARYMKNPEDVRVKSKRVTLDEIKQIAVETTDRGKQDTLCRMIDEDRPYLAIIFCRTKRRASTLNEALIERGYDSDELHGDLSQAKREQVMRRFREAKLQILVATDVAARGLDVEGVTHVFNYDMPQDVESYIHRIGRTGRAGQRGAAITFVAPRDRMKLEMIEKGIGSSIEKRNAEGKRLGHGGPSAGKSAGKGPGSASSSRGNDRAGRAGRRGRGRADGAKTASRSEAGSVKSNYSGKPDRFKPTSKGKSDGQRRASGASAADKRPQRKTSANRGAAQQSRRGGR